MSAQEERVGKHPPMTDKISHILLDSIYNFICSFFSLFMNTEKSVYNLAQAIEQAGNPEVPLTTEDGGEVAVSNKSNDDQDEDDPYTKRRY